MNYIPTTSLSAAQNKITDNKGINKIKEKKGISENLSQCTGISPAGVPVAASSAVFLATSVAFEYFHPLADHFSSVSLK